MLKSKKGIEPVIATVLLIVITIAVVGVVVAFLYPYIKGMLDKETACNGVKLEIDSGTGNTFTNPTATWVMVSYTSGKINQTRVVVQATGQGTTLSNSNPSNIIKINEARTFMVDISNAMKVGAVPYITYNGKEYMCENGKAELTSVPTR